MTHNRNKNIAAIVAAAFLFLALFDGWPYGFFTLLRLIVFATTGYLAWVAYRIESQTWAWLLGFVALVFNPVMPVHLDRDTWIVIDLLVAGLLIISIFALQFSREEED